MPSRCGNPTGAAAIVSRGTMTAKSDIRIDRYGFVVICDVAGVEVRVSPEIVRKAAVEVERWQRLQKESRKQSGRELREFDAYRVETSRLEVA